MTDNNPAPQPADMADSEVEGDAVTGGGITAQATDKEAEETLVVDLDGYEGPLDLLLVLARSQKVDLRKISILQLADQFIRFIAEARRLRLELAADYLVMAAWLAYMKSRLLLPEQPSDDEEPTGEELAARLAYQLQRLEAMRQVAARLMARPRLLREVFPRGAPEGIRTIRTPLYQASLFELLKAYGKERTKNIEITYELKKRPTLSIEEARARVEHMLGRIPDWSRLELFAPAVMLRGQDGEDLRRSSIASILSASLELVKEGLAELRQETSFSPIYVRARMRAPDAPEEFAHG